MSKWTEAEEELLITTVQLFPCLYRTSDKNYKNKLAREQKWRLIAKKLNKEGPEVKARWTSLRKAFMQFLRKVKKPTDSGLRPCFRHEKSMQFIKDMGEIDDSTLTNLKSESEHDDSNSFDITELTEVGIALDEHTQNHALAFPTKTFRANDVPLLKKRKMADLEAEILEASRTEVIEDEFITFAKVIAGKMRKISQKSYRKYLELQNIINNKVFEYELELENN